MSKLKSELQSIRAKIKEENYLELVNYCKSSGITVSSYVRSLIEKNNPATISIKKAGNNNFRFNPLKDIFLWEINFDDGSREVIAEDLSDAFLENLKKSIEKTLESRKEHIKKKMDGSVSIPKINKLKRGDDIED